MARNRDAKDARRAAMVRRVGVYACEQVSPGRTVAQLSRAELKDVSLILLDASLAATRAEYESPAPRRGPLVLVASDGEPTIEGQAILEQRAAERERRRQRRAVKHG